MKQKHGPLSEQGQKKPEPGGRTDALRTPLWAKRGGGVQDTIKNLASQDQWIWKRKKIEKEKKKTAGQTKNGYRGKVMGCFMLPKQIAWIPEQ